MGMAGAGPPRASPAPSRERPECNRDSRNQARPAATSYGEPPMPLIVGLVGMLRTPVGKRRWDVLRLEVEAGTEADALSVALAAAPTVFDSSTYGEFKALSCETLEAFERRSTKPDGTKMDGFDVSRVA